MAQIEHLAPRAHIFDRCGLAALSDLSEPVWEHSFETLARDQDKFLEVRSAFLDKGYHWPRDPLRTWSRLWEYPYAYHHLERVIAERPAGSSRLVDVGSGVTFFTFSAARLGFHVTCLDIDPICAEAIPRAAKLVPHHPGKVDVALIHDAVFPLDDCEVDVVMSISV